MNVQKIAISKSEALELYRKYKTHQHHETDLDREVKRTYQLISQGRVIIQAFESIKQAGVDEKGLPKLALAGATARACVIQRWRDGSMSMSSEYPPAQNGSRPREKAIRRFNRSDFNFPAETFPLRGNFRDSVTRHSSSVPIIPIHLRPKRGLENYHILWEAEWQPVPTRDPYLLRRIGKADLWLVCAAWDLTEVERAAMATRISAQ